MTVVPPILLTWHDLQPPVDDTAIFNIVQDIEVESQAMLNTSYRNILRNGRRAGNGTYARKRATLRIMVASRPELSFNQMTVAVPKIMDQLPTGHERFYS
jgi:hypothetical protein